LLALRSLSVAFDDLSPDEPAMSDSCETPGFIKATYVVLMVVLFLNILLRPITAGAQQPEQIFRVGFLVTGRNAPNGVRQALRQNGYTEGRNLVIEQRTADSPQQFAVSAAELVRLKVTVIFAEGPAAVKAAVRATHEIPIVAIDMETDPVEAGLITSLSRPGRNVTGVFLDAPELVGKWFELLKEILPRLTRVVALWDPSTGRAQVTAASAAAQALRVQLHTVEVKGGEDITRALSTVAKGRPDALVLLSSPLISFESSRIAEFALERRLPAISMFPPFVRSGGLLRYGPDFNDLFVRCAQYVIRILKGAKPGELPVQRPDTFTLMINRKTANALGLTISQSFLLRADQVIE
jgi:putative tryptophan/tyrosine transport system substrate-binding protein